MTRALVLGAGISPGLPWQAGLIEGLRRAGTDLGSADLIVATSAGAFAGALLAFGADLEPAIDGLLDAADAAPPARPSADRFLTLFEILADTAVPAEERRTRAARLSPVPDAGAAARRVDLVVGRLPSEEWPDYPLLLVAVDADTGERVVWRRGGAAPLGDALRAACATPTIFAPVEAGGRRCVDGLVASTTHADLTAGHDRVVVLDSLGHLRLPTAVLDAELAAVRPAATAVVGPGVETMRMFPLDIFDAAASRSAFQAGVRQAEAEADAVARVWNG
ncbi:patatin-like phospholipase family protein [Actinomadura atramentaria]|uniref:patatin-like phospholipase family protein n=1 Tax=Actinomadura atramentaria TaxID=1990 RepID=UPI0003612CD7|nr:patatin-like phospholipase family protein [Actinomadura atramentaria]